jgi:hypothetical protein
MANLSIDMAGHLRLRRGAASTNPPRLRGRVHPHEPAARDRHLDARSRENTTSSTKGAINLSSRHLVRDPEQGPSDKKTRILIYCNNFREGIPAFPTKAVTSALNLSTFITLMTTGIATYELAPLLDAETSKLPFEGRARVSR